MILAEAKQLEGRETERRAKQSWASEVAKRLDCGAFRRFRDRLDFILLEVRGELGSY